jgi:PleD family two-component response regulator
LRDGCLISLSKLNYLKEDKMVDTNMNILIVDDFASMRKRLKNVLKQPNFANVEEA